MLSAEMLSWILAALRFNSIARICDSRTPVTVTSFNSSAALSCCAGPCAPAFSAGAPVFSADMADVAAAASNAMDIAIDRGCLRYAFDTAFPSIVIVRISDTHGALRDLSLSNPTTDIPTHLCFQSVYLFGRLTNQSRMTRGFRQV